MPGIIATAAEGLIGFDTNQPLTADLAKRFVEAGFSFCCRYVRRQNFHPGDLTDVEVDLLHDAGLAVMPVQHVESESSWIPTAAKGYSYGVAATEAAIECDILKGTNVWLDLEGVDPSISASQIIDFCVGWHTRVSLGGFTPGIYVGWHNGLTPDQLHMLPFEHYWGAYNLNRDEQPSHRGLQMQQHPHAGIVGCSDIDSDVIFADKLGGLPVLCAPLNWPC